MIGRVETFAGGESILWDPEAMERPGADFFRGLRAGKAENVEGGRGRIRILEAAGRSCVLRHYRRGGLVEFISQDLYFWAGLERTRAFREWRLLARMRAEGLPVPRPLAAGVRRRGLLYRQDILIERIPNVETLAARLSRAPLAAEDWERIGAALARFTRARYFHADLNAHNVLLGAGEAVYLIDFDRGVADVPPVRAARALGRLCHSLKRLASRRPGFQAGPEERALLAAAYRAALGWPGEPPAAGGTCAPRPVEPK
ncbi:MAG: 3-deoxy-D-manno-octulosonic acid kinase [Puniceicoccaceae bacterium]|nr:MAG: 3-deoxy-D-manno-octulosonic acid kinase [Puniceicoccaceae bacterium]